MNSPPMNLRLASGSVTPGEPGHEAFFGVHHDQRDVVMIAEQGLDLVALVHSKQAVIDEHAGQLVADRLVDEDRRDRGCRRRPTGRR